MNSADFDLTTVGGATLVVLTLVSAVKAGWPAWIEGKEKRLALLVGLLVGILAKITGAMFVEPGAQGWAKAVVGGIALGIAAQIAHDKGLNALKEKKGSDAAPPPPSGPTPAV